MKRFTSTTIPSVYRHRSGSLYCRINRNGKDLWRSLKTQDIEVAKVKALQLMTSKCPEIKADLSTFGTALAEFERRGYYNGVRRSAIKPSSLSYIKGRILFIKKTWPELHDSEVASLAAPAFEDWVQRCIKTYSPSGINGAVSIVRGVFKMLTRLGVILRDPTADLTALQVRSKVPVLPTKAQFAALLNWLGERSLKTRFAAELLAYSGLRIGEARGLRWEDWDQASKTLTVSRQLSEFGETTLKNGETRVIDCNPALQGLLVSNWCILGIAPSYPVLNVGDINPDLALACEALHLPKMTNHTLRHYFCSTCIEAGCDFKTVATWMGHRDGGVLLAKLYAHLRRDHGKAQAKRVEF